jgi:hypothetical protein
VTETSFVFDPLPDKPEVIAPIVMQMWQRPPANVLFSRAWCLFPTLEAEVSTERESPSNDDWMHLPRFRPAKGGGSNPRQIC